ncbi:DUF1801 domain-containing protein [Allosphingosinicella deserti]|uniref:DUF1801 domain-containing protein n=1 Tax=Allosphingosinicella deserti TaxID=2116704 RepID=A0A2P7QI34_9SPHN|nr:DUF1801 domain-containing protein [Sphingomonas deserti]PSJ37621.1 DUF1801 domain-containing protein [Sphingomonas deserti]
MVSSQAATPEAYLAELEPERAAFVARLRDLINANLPSGYEERMNWGMISWEVPLSRYPNTYNGQPLGYAALAAQKNFTALYLTCVYASEERTERLKRDWASAGKRLDMGKSCLRLKGPQDLAEEVLAATIRAVPVDVLIAEHERARAR